MIKIGFKKLQLFAVVLALFIVSTQCDSFPASFTCQKCKMSCAVANCLRVAASGYDQEYCPSTSCTLGYNFSMTVDKCTYDFAGNACSTNLCYYPTSKSICASTILGATCSFGSFLLSQACQTCSNTSGCANCLTYSTNLVSTKSESCLGSICKGVQNLTGYVYPCTRDANGEVCSCCMNVTTSVTRMPGLCSTSSPLTSNLGFFNYAYNIVQKNTTSSTHEFYAMMNLILLLCMLFFAS